MTGNLVLMAAFTLAAVSTASGQPRALTLDELRRELRAGDVISIVQGSGGPVSGRLMRFGDTQLEIRADLREPSGQRRRQLVTIPVNAIQSLDRPRDSSRNGALIGAGIGAGFTATMMISAFITDRNEADEWAPIFLAGGAVITGIGAVAGWAIDRAHSKPHVRYDSPPAGKTTIRAVPLLRRGRGLALVVSF